MSVFAGKKAAKKRLWFSLKLATAAAALAILFYFRMIRLDALALLAGHPWTLLIAGLIFFCTLPLGALRWRILLAVQGIVLPFWQIYNICAIGALISVVFPGAVSGDALRFLYVAAAVPRRRTILGVTLVADRLLGLLGLGTVAATAIALQWPRVAASPGMKSVAVPIVVGFVVALAGGGVLFFVLDKLPFERLGLRQRGSLLRILNTVIDVAVLYRRAAGPLLRAFALSLVIQACSIAAVVLLADSMELSNLMGPLQYSLAGSLAILASAIPVTPGGIGVGEGAFQHLCLLLSNTAAPYASAFFAFRGLTIAVLLAAIPSLIAYRSRSK